MRNDLSSADGSVPAIDGATSYPVLYLVGVQLYNRGDYFESHEAWEDLWRETTGAGRNFYKGLIQIAVALCHYCNGNPRGARKLYRSGRAYLEPYGEKRMGLDLAGWLARLALTFTPVLAAESDAPLDPLDLDGVPRLVLEPAPETWPAIPDEYEPRGGSGAPGNRSG